MLQQFVTQLKQNYPSIKDIRIPAEDALLANLQEEEAEPEAPAAESADTEEKAGAPTSEQEKNQKALAGQSFSMVIVLKQYNLKTVNALLIEISDWAAQQECDAQPVLLTHQETEQLQGFLDGTMELTPANIVESYRSREGYPSNARRHILVVLEEIQRLLRNLEQDYPTSGQHALNNGLYVQSLFEQLTRWGATIFHQSFTTPEDTWNFLLQQFPGHRYLNQPQNAYLPTRLKAFIQRHRMLAPLASQSFDNNDLEIENLSQPLVVMARSLRMEATRRLTPVEERKQRNRRRLLFTGVSVGTVLALVLGVWWYLRPPVMSSSPLPKGSQPGGIVGNYYGGQNFTRYITKRTDYGINMNWPGSPLAKVPSDYFSVRWKGFLEAPTPGKYRICSTVDDGVQLRLNSKELINDWRVGSARTKCKVVHLEKGWHSLFLQMFEARGGSVIKLSWEKPNQPGIRPIPGKHLCCKK